MLKEAGTSMAHQAQASLHLLLQINQLPLIINARSKCMLSRVCRGSFTFSEGNSRKDFAVMKIQDLEQPILVLISVCCIARMLL